LFFLRWQRSEGFQFDLPYTIENVRENFDKVCNFEGKNEYPSGSNYTIPKFFENIERNKNKATAAANCPKSTPECPKQQATPPALVAVAPSNQKTNFSFKKILSIFPFNFRIRFEK
jgi:hypothetical protein